MPEVKDFLFEIGCEELPPKQLKHYSLDLKTGMEKALNQFQLSFVNIRCFATPRRLAVYVSDLLVQQKDYWIEKKGPQLKSAFDEQGNPTKAALGFASSCGVNVMELEKVETSSSAYLSHRYLVKGKPTEILLPEICQQAVSHIYLAKPMRWASNSPEFIRPVHWLVMLYGEDIIKANILNLKASNLTYGHRFHHPEPIAIKAPQQYESLLQEIGYVVPDYNVRRDLIKKQILEQADLLKASTSIDEKLLDEVTGLVEWPVALTGAFDEAFLKIPKEALISSMKVHQKVFPVSDNRGQLVPYFISIANIKSLNPKRVIKGNQRVLKARLTDAAFFYHTDSRVKLEHRLESLKQILFQAKLGTLFDKSLRISQLANYISQTIGDSYRAERAGLLCKTDLTTDMVKEFPELQGIMGYYYALHDDEPQEVAQALRDHYKPRFAGDELPQNNVGDAVALADKIDTLVGIFGINQAPSGEKDPFALRRAALGILRILIQHKHNLNIIETLAYAQQNYLTPLPNANVVNEVHQFILERLYAWYQEENITSDTLTAVLEAKAGKAVPLDIHRRVQAVNEFRKLPEAEALTIANKRASNILAKTNHTEQFRETNPLNLINTQLFEHKEEQNLYEIIARLANTSSTNYTQILKDFASLREPVDRFFDNVLVMTENEKIRTNRLALLAALRELFLAVADISKLT